MEISQEPSALDILSMPSSTSHSLPLQLMNLMAEVEAEANALQLQGNTTRKTHPSPPKNSPPRFARKVQTNEKTCSKRREKTRRTSPSREHQHNVPGRTTPSLGDATDHRLNYMPRRTTSPPRESAMNHRLHSLQLEVEQERKAKEDIQNHLKEVRNSHSFFFSFLHVLFRKSASYSRISTTCKRRKQSKRVWPPILLPKK